MSNYTTTLKNICDASPTGRQDLINVFTSYNLSDYLTPGQIETIENTGNWSPYKLANKIIDYYYLREIGLETYGLFKHQAKIEMELLMEYYLPLIYSRAIEYDPLVNVDFTETYTAEDARSGTSGSHSTTVSSDNGISTSKYSVTPSVGIQNIKDAKYLSNYTENETSNSGTSGADSTGTEQTSGTSTYTKRIKGNSGVSATAQKMIEQFRNNIRAIDDEIINKLSSLFMAIY
jgi:hypothetical protein